MNKYIIVGKSCCCQSNLIVGKCDFGLFVFCDECEASWESLGKASEINNINPNIELTGYPTKEEVERNTSWPILDIAYDTNLFLAEDILNKNHDSERYLCPVCYSQSLREHPYDFYGIGSFEMCNVCGFIFGKYDRDNKIECQKRWKAAWVKSGSKVLGKLPMFERMSYYKKIYDIFVNNT